MIPSEPIPTSPSPQAGLLRLTVVACEARVKPLGPGAINSSYDGSDQAHTQQWLDPDAHSAAAEALARLGAQATGVQLTADAVAATLAELEDEELRAEIGERRILFAEDGLRVIWEDLLGLPSLDNVFEA